MSHIPKSKELDNINIVRGSLLDLDVDVIVNAANKELRGGGGIDGMVHKLAGPDLAWFLKNIYPKGIKTGGVAFTPGFGLKQKHIIHTAGPIWQGGTENEEDDLYNCYIYSCCVAHSFGLKSIGFCSISTGIYGYPLEEAVPVAIEAINIASKYYPLDVTIALFGEQEFKAYEDYYNSF
jgi:O-acetyl-ADP-ribose deacetylase (regulator of RNase III)